MSSLIVTSRVMDLVRANTDPNLGFRQTATRLPDGTWSIPVADDTVERLRGYQLEGETDSDTVERIICTQQGTN